MGTIFLAKFFAKLGKSPPHVFPHGSNDFHVLVGHLGGHTPNSIKFKLMSLRRSEHPAFERFPIAPPSLLGFLAGSFGSFETLGDLAARFFHPPFEVAFSSLQLHVEIVPDQDARDYSSDKNLWNNLHAEV